MLTYLKKRICLTLEKLSYCLSGMHTNMSRTEIHIRGAHTDRLTVARKKDLAITDNMRSHTK